MSPRATHIDPITGRRLRNLYREHGEYAAMVRRLIRSLARRAGTDVEALPELQRLGEYVEEQMAIAVGSLRDEGYSWGEIAQRLGVTRQSVWERYHRAATDQPEQRQASPDSQSRAS